MLVEVAGGSSEHRRGRMPRLTGTIAAGGAPAGGAYVQIQNVAGDFQAEVRTDAAGRFVLHPVRGRWRLVCWLPGDRRGEREVEVGAEDLRIAASMTLRSCASRWSTSRRSVSPSSSVGVGGRCSAQNDRLSA